MAKVQLESLGKRYPNGHVAVAEASFEVADGELLVLVGPSGCGKSTLLRMIAGLESITSGTLRIGERIVNDVAPKDRDIAMVFQNYALYPHMSVAENLGFGLKLRGLDKAAVEARVRESARMLELDQLLERKPGQLSGGQRQRVALGRALVRQPQVFLLDEPLSNLDAKLRGSMRVEIARLHRQLAATMIYVTHDQVEAMTLGQRIVVLKDGLIQQIDTPMALYARPANVFVATFLGTPQMNLLRAPAGGRAGSGDTLTLTLADGQALALAAAPATRWLQANPDREVVIGVRPEDLHVLAGDEARPGLQAIVEVVEPVGSEAFVILRCGDERLTIRVLPGQIPALGQQVRLGCDAQRLHLFDAANEQRIAPDAVV